MKAICLLLALVLLTVPFALAEPTVCTAGTEPYFHARPDCRFGCFGAQDFSGTQRCTEAEALGQGKRPCPGCMGAPVFTGEFPEWTHDVMPWDFGGMDTWLSSEILVRWGDAGDALRALDALPGDFAGLFRNACGGYTVMLVHPDEVRIAQLRSQLGCEFWVMDAEFRRSDLDAIQAAVCRLMEEGRFGVHGCYVKEDANRTVIETDDASEETVRGVADALAEAGFEDPRMYHIEATPRAEWM